MSSDSNEVILAYFSEIRYLNVITSNLIDTLNRTNDNLVISLNRYFGSNSVNSHETNRRTTNSFFRDSSGFTDRREPYTRDRTRRNPLNRDTPILTPPAFTSATTSFLSPSRNRASPRRRTPFTEERLQSENGEIVLTGVVDMTPVPVFPSTRQVVNATEILRFGDIEQPLNDSCPITMESFTENDSVCRIKHCKHIFKERALYNWFVEHVGCPVCRFDIRDDEANENVPNEEYTFSSTSTTLPDELVSSFTSILSGLGRGPRIDISSTSL